MQNDNLPPGISCLLANTSNSDSFISLSLIIRCNSDFASSMRALSLESMTKINPWVPVIEQSALALNLPQSGYAIFLPAYVVHPFQIVLRHEFNNKSRDSQHTTEIMSP